MKTRNIVILASALLGLSSLACPVKADAARKDANLIYVPYYVVDKQDIPNVIKRVKQTVKYVDTKGKKLAKIQKLNGKWTTSSWPKYKDYKASKSVVKSFKVTSKTNNRTVKITYSKAK